jgi:hypothetical protein
MGAAQFVTPGKGKTAGEAFQKAVEQACHFYGHSGYTGTIAEKISFIELKCPEDKDPFDYVSDLLDNDDPRIDDKWAPAGCVKIKDGEHLFFGWASE